MTIDFRYFEAWEPDANYIYRVPNPVKLLPKGTQKHLAEWLLDFDKASFHFRAFASDENQTYCILRTHGHHGVYLCDNHWIEFPFISTRARWVCEGFDTPVFRGSYSMITAKEFLDGVRYLCRANEAQDPLF